MSSKDDSNIRPGGGTDQFGACAPLTFLPPHKHASEYENGPAPGYKEVVDYSQGQQVPRDYVAAQQQKAATSEASSSTSSAAASETGTEGSTGDPSVHCWNSPSGTSFPIRGKGYLTDRKKVEHPSKYMCNLEAVQLFKTNGPAVNDIAAREDSFLAERRKSGDQRYYIIVNLQCGGNPSPHLVLYFAMRENAFSKEVLGKDYAAAERCWKRFLNGNDEYKNARWKVIPSVPEGNWAVRNSIGQKPALLANKLTHTWRQNDKMNYLEVDCDVASSKVATYLMGVVHNNARHIVVNLGFLVESRREDELPEHLIGAVSMHRMYLSNVPVVDPKDNFRVLSRYSAEQLGSEGESAEDGGWFSGMVGAGMRAFGY